MNTNDSIKVLLEHEIKDYEDMSQNTDYSEQLREGYEATANVLKAFQKKINRNFFIYNKSTVIDILAANYTKNDTEFVFTDGTSYVIPKTHQNISIEDNYVLIRKETEEVGTLGPVLKAINLDNVKMIKTLSQ